VKFDGTGDYIQITIPVQSAAPLSICAWFNSSDAASEQCIASIADTAADNDYWSLQAQGDVAGDYLRWRSFDATASDAITTRGYAADKWHLACGVEVSNTSRVAYLDGAAAGTNTTDKSPDDVDVLSIGALVRTSVGSEFTGKIADVRVFDYALSAAQAAALFDPQTRWDLYYSIGRTTYFA
jgi:hypothetical protein